MSRGLVKNIGWDGLIRQIEQQAHDAWRLPASSCPWCGEDLGGGQRNESAPSSDGDKTTSEAMRLLAVRFANDPLCWTVAMLLVADPSASDRTLAASIGIGKTKVNDARRRLRAICPGISDLAAEYDNTVRAQKSRRKSEGKTREAPQPLVGTIKGRVQSRFAPMPPPMAVKRSIATSTPTLLFDAIV